MIRYPRRTYTSKLQDPSQLLDSWSWNMNAYDYISGTRYRIFAGNDITINHPHPAWGVRQTLQTTIDRNTGSAYDTWFAWRVVLIGRGGRSWPSPSSTGCGNLDWTFHVSTVASGGNRQSLRLNVRRQVFVDLSRGHLCIAMICKAPRCHWWRRFKRCLRHDSCQSYQIYACHRPGNSSSTCHFTMTHHTRRLACLLMTYGFVIDKHQHLHDEIIWRILLSNSIGAKRKSKGFK